MSDAWAEKRRKSEKKVIEAKIKEGKQAVETPEGPEAKLVSENVAEKPREDVDGDKAKLKKRLIAILAKEQHEYFKTVEEE